MKLIRTCLLLFSLTFGAASSGWSVPLKIFVWGVDESSSGPLQVAFGAQQLATGTYIATHGEEITLEEGELLLDNQGNPVVPETYVSEAVTYRYLVRNEYSVDFPEEYAGSSVTVSWNGGQAWTGYKPVTDLSPGAELTFVLDEGYSAFAADVPSMLHNRVGLGVWWNQTNRALITAASWNNANPYWPCIGLDFFASAPNAYWRWFHPSDDGALQRLAMELDYQNRLTLRGRTNNGRVVIDPNLGQISINGTVVLPGSGGGGSFNTTDLALGSGSSADSSGATGSGELAGLLPGSIGIGQQSNAVARSATALGAHSQASDGGTALGARARALGRASLAAGVGAEVTSTASAGLAIGPFARALAAQSAAIGYRTTAQGFGQVVLGVNNAPVGNGSSALDPNSEVLVVGAGYYAPSTSGGPPDSQPSNAFTIKRNGDGHFRGALSLGTGTVLATAGAGSGDPTGQLVVGRYNDDTKLDGLLIVGNGSGVGTAARSNALRLLDDGTLLIQPRGDLEMLFRGGPTP